MGRPRSLAWRLVWRLLVAESIIVIAVTVLDTVWIDSPASPIFYSWQRSLDLVVDSLASGPDGTLRIVPTPDLLAYAARRPHFEYAVIARPSGRAAEGSFPALLADIRSTSQVQVTTWVFTSPRPGTPPLEGGAETVDTRFGKVTVFIYGGDVHADDMVVFIWSIVESVIRYVIPAFAAIVVLSLRAIRGALKPLQLAGQQTAQLDFHNPTVRLPEDGRVPRELTPLVRGVNRALDRLQDGFHRQQRFTANAAHEIRTPLAILRARIDSLDLPSQNELRRDAQRITSLVDQMLAIARLAHNSDSYETFDLVESVASLVSDFAPLALDGGRLVEFAAAKNRVLVRANRRALDSAIGNLIDNALHAEPLGGTVTVTVSDDAAVTVQDHGPGVAQEETELIFEPFWRRDETRVGTGLGLAIVREIATLHGGTATVHPTPGGGATFRLWLGAALVDPNATRAPVATEFLTSTAIRDAVHHAGAIMPVGKRE